MHSRSLVPFYLFLCPGDLESEATAAHALYVQIGGLRIVEQSINHRLRRFIVYQHGVDHVIRRIVGAQHAALPKV